VLPSGNYSLTRSGSNEDLNVRGDLDVRENLTIIGAGADATIISAGGLSGVFQVVSGTLTMSGVTVQDGAASFGAGILVNGGASLNLSQSVVRNNTAGSGGGGVYASATGAVVT
jgi:predicted outer membrane repeat protein